MKPGRPSGVALSTTLFVMVLLLIAAFSMASIASFNYQMAKHCQLRNEAFDGANAGLSYAIDTLRATPVWGRPGDVLPETALSTGAITPQDPTHFYVTFAVPPPPGYPGQLPCSINNLQNNKTVPGPVDPATNQPRRVPPHTALIFVEGVAGQGGQIQSCTLEAMLQFPPYPYAVAASGGVVSWDAKVGYYTQNVTQGALQNAIAIDSLLPDTGGNVLALGGYDGGTPQSGPQSGVSPPYGIFLAPGSVITGTARHVSSTNLVVGDPSQQTQGGPPIAQQIADATEDDKIPQFAPPAPDASTTVLQPSYISQMNVSGQRIDLENTSYRIDVPPGSNGMPTITLGVDAEGGNPVPVILNNADLYVYGIPSFAGGIVGPMIPGTQTYSPARGNIYIMGPTNLQQFAPATICLYKGGSQYADTGMVGTGVCIYSNQVLQIQAVGGYQNLAPSDTFPIYGTIYSQSDISISKSVLVHGSVVGRNVFLDYGCHITYDPARVPTTTLSPPSSDGSGGGMALKIVYWREAQ